MRKVATAEYTNKDGEPCEKRTYKISEALKITAYFGIGGDDKRYIESFTFARSGFKSQPMTLDEMLEILNGFKSIQSDGSLP